MRVMSGPWARLHLMTDERRQIPEAELRRLTLAVTDMRAASAMVDLLKERRGRDRLGGTARENGLMTGLVVSYARPFSRSNRIGRIDERFERFEAPEREAHHKQLLGLRNKLYAHTDVTILRDVIVFPPGAWGPGVSAIEATVPWAVEAFEKFGSLIELQEGRLAKRIVELVEELYGGREWRPGEQIHLKWPDDPNVTGGG